MCITSNILGECAIDTPSETGTKKLHDMKSLVAGSLSRQGHVKGPYPLNPVCLFDMEAVDALSI